MEQTGTSGGVRRPRRDAERNRAAILAAARSVFSQRGNEVDVREVARCAGVGMGTLYRHFPTKGELLDTVLREDFQAWNRSARQSATDHGDPWQALSAFLDDALTRQVSHRAMLERFADSWETTVAISECRREIHPLIEDLVARCHASGVLRAGVGSEDISVLLIALGKVVELTAQDRPELWRRHLRISLDGLRACHDEALPRAPAPESLAAPAPSGSPARGRFDRAERTTDHAVSR